MGYYISPDYARELDAQPRMPGLSICAQRKEYMDTHDPPRWRKDYGIYLKDIKPNEFVAGVIYEESKFSENQIWDICQQDGSRLNYFPGAADCVRFFTQAEPVLLVQSKRVTRGDFLKGTTVSIYNIAIVQDAECYSIKKTKLWAGDPRRLPKSFNALKQIIKHQAFCLL